MRKRSQVLLMIGSITMFLLSMPLLAQEASEFNEGSKVERDDANEIWRFKWWGKAGRTYFIQHSENLLEPWQWVPVIESGDDSVKEWGFTTSGDRFFVRMKYTDMATLDPENDDFDLDGVSNFDELQQGTDPFSAADRDGNGMFDDWEIKHFGATGQNVADDPDGDGLTNLQECFLGSTPHNSDTDGDGLRDDEDSNPLESEIHGSLWLGVTVPDRELWAEGEIEIEEVDDTHIRLEWGYDGDGITHFLIERRISAGPWEEQARVSASVHEWEDEDLQANQNYYYRIRAVRASRRGDIFSSASQEVAYQVPFLKAFSARSGLLGRWKSQWSFREFETDAPAPAVPKYYLVKTDTWIYDWRYYYHNDHESSSFEISIDYTYIQTFDPSAHIYTQNGTREKSSDLIIIRTGGGSPYIDGQREVENYEWFEQGRGKQNLTGHAEGRYEGAFSHWDAIGMISSSYYAGYYLLDGVYVPDQGDPVWMGNDFDLSQGRINYSGLSTFETSDDYYQGSPDIDGKWSSLPWRGGTGWVYVGGPDIQSSTPTRRSYWTEDSEGFEELSEEYTTEAFMTDVSNDLPDWPEWNHYYYGWNWWGGYGNWDYGEYYDGRLAHRSLSASEEYFSLGRSQYRFQSNPTVPYTWTWHEIFMPDDDPETPEDESLNPQVVVTHTWSVPLGGGESTDYEIDSSQHTGGNGRYYLDTSLQVKGLASSSTWMDEQEKQSSGLTFEKNGSDYEAFFWLELGGASQSHTFSWQGAGITLWARYYENSQWVEREIHNGETLTREELQGMIHLQFILRAIPTQMSTGFAGVTVSAVDSQDTSMGSDSINAKFLPTLLVDANRDGLLSFSDPQIRAADATDANSKFRFWVNDDNDGIGDGEEILGSNPDSADNEVRSKRDLEDFTRLHVYFGGLQVGIADGTFKIGLKWKNTGALKPAVKIYQAMEADGGTAYLSSETTAAAQISSDYKTAKATVSGANTVVALLPSSVFANYSTENPVVHLLFEGVSEGMGELVVTLHKADGTEIGEGFGVWLDIVDVKKMYQSSESNMFVEAQPGEAEQTVVFVHGWNMSPEGSRNYAETMFKRLWHRGFKGRFACFRWNTDWLSAFDVIGTLTAQYFANYNNSEYKAWIEDALALKSFVASLPYAKNIVAHSMGNIVVGEAMRLGMQVDNYALMQPSVPAACYDEREVLKQTTTYQHSFIGLNFTMWDEESPDDDPDEATRNMSYRGALKDIGQNGNLILFYLPNDEATSYAWELNNDITKPSGFLSGHFRYNRSGQSGQKLYKDYGEGLHDYFWASRRETMSFACRTWGKAAGAEPQTEGAIRADNRVDLGASTYHLPGEDGGFGRNHSGQFKERIQNLKTFYDTLMLRLDVGTPNP